MNKIGILLVSLLFVFVVIGHYFLTPKIAYVNTGKVMVGFSDAAKVEKELSAEEEKWQKQLQEMEKELKAAVDSMSLEFNSAPAARKKELQDMLSARNQQINNFKQVNNRRMNELKAKKMKTVIDKINVYTAEFGKKHRYDILFGTVAGGSILYGNNAYDATDALIHGLNERYK